MSWSRSSVVVIVGCASIAQADVIRTPRIIRPPDDRVDHFATTPALQVIGDSVAAQITTDMLTAHADGSFTIAAPTLAEQFSPLCDGERFGDQPTAASCTATLVGSDILVTAGHCLDENGVRTDLSTIYFVFDYAVRQEGVNPATFSADQVYRATEVLGLANVADTANDWAVVRLDRAVTGRTPVGVRSDGAIAQGQSVVAIGFGAGLPIKFSDNATVQSLVDFGFEADFDIIAGNSGGPIVNPETGLIEAVLSADQGSDDIFQDGACFRSLVCPQDPQCETSFTLLASVMIPEFQAAIRSAIGGGGAGDDDGTDDQGSDDGGTDDDGSDDDTTDDDGEDDDSVADADDDGVEDESDLCDDTADDAEVDDDGCVLEELTTGAGPVCGTIGMIPMLFMLLVTGASRRRYAAAL